MHQVSWHGQPWASASGPDTAACISQLKNAAARWEGTKGTLGEARCGLWHANGVSSWFPRAWFLRSFKFQFQSMWNLSAKPLYLPCHPKILPHPSMMIEIEEYPEGWGEAVAQRSKPNRATAKRCRYKRNCKRAQNGHEQQCRMMGKKTNENFLAGKQSPSNIKQRENAESKRWQKRTTEMEENRRGQEIVLLLLCSVLLGDDPCKLHFPGCHYPSAPSSWLQPSPCRRLERKKGEVRVFLLLPLSHVELLSSDCLSHVSKSPDRPAMVPVSPGGS